jgi:hypothetical protein
MHFVNKPEVQARIWGATPVFDPATGDVIDEGTSGKVKEVGTC